MAIDVERMNHLMNCVSSGVPIEEACKDAEEESFYREVASASVRLKREGHGRMPIGEWP